MTMKSFENVIRSNPHMQAAITPYVSMFQRFQFTSIPLGDTVQHPLVSIQLPIELIVVVARAANLGTINIWSESINAGMGWTLNATDVFVMTIDNMAWDVADAMCHNMCIENKLPRRALDTTQLFIQASAATQIADIALGFGPQQ